MKRKTKTRTVVGWAADNGHGRPAITHGLYKRRKNVRQLFKPEICPPIKVTLSWEQPIKTR